VTVNADIKAVNALVRTKGKKGEDDVPHFIMGHSAGGFLALNYVIYGREQFAGVIASAPLTKLYPEPPMIQRILLF
jgi:alpha-beta hydrolase superfamily lysophospholipase